MAIIYGTVELPTFSRILKWYSENVPKYLISLNDNQVYKAFQTAFKLNLSADEIYYAFQQDTDITIEDINSHYFTSRYSPLLIQSLFGSLKYQQFPDDSYAMYGIPQVVSIRTPFTLLGILDAPDETNPYWRTDTPDPTYGYLEQTEPVAMPLWTSTIKRYSIARNLAIINPVADTNWLQSSSDTSGVTQSIYWHTLPTMGWENRSAWGNHIPTSVLQFTKPQDWVQIQNAIVLEYARLISYRQWWMANGSDTPSQWQLNDQESSYEPQQIDSLKQYAALMFAESLLYARLVHEGYGIDASQQRAMNLRQIDVSEWIPVQSNQERIYEAILDRRQTIMQRQALLASPILGKGFLISELALMWPNYDMITGHSVDYSIRKTQLRYTSSSGLLTRSMILFLRNLTRPFVQYWDDLNWTVPLIRTPLTYPNYLAPNSSRVFQRVAETELNTYEDMTPGIFESGQFVNGWWGMQTNDSQGSGVEQQGTVPINMTAITLVMPGPYYDDDPQGVNPELLGKYMGDMAFFGASDIGASASRQILRGRSRYQVWSDTNLM